MVEVVLRNLIVKEVMEKIVNAIEENVVKSVLDWKSIVNNNN